MPSSTFSRLMTTAGKQRRGLIWSCVLAALSSGFAIAPYLLLYFALGAFEGGEKVAFWALVVLAVTFLLFQPVCFGWSTWIAHKMAFDALHDLRIRILGKLARLPLGFFTKRQSGEIKYLINENVEVLELFYSHQLPDIVAAIVMPVAALVLLIVADWRLGLAAAGIIPIIWLANVLMMRGHGEKIGMYFGMLSQVNAAFVEFLQGIETIKKFDGGKKCSRRLQERVDGLSAFSADWQKSWLGPWTLFFVASGASLLFVLPVGLMLISLGIGTTQSLLFSVLCSTGIGAPVIKLMVYTEIFLRVQKAEGSITRLLGQPELDQSEGTQAELAPGPIGISFRDVTLQQDEHEILKGVSFDVPARKTTAIVGGSGAGKSTVVRLIARYLDASNGEIRLGDHDIRHYALEDVQKNVALISQNIFLFNDTVFENIRMGRRKFDRDAVIAVAKAANAHDFIEELANGYDSPVGENGSLLSGGERQRLALARALLGASKILILDEATAHLDAKHESLVQQAINRLAGHKTIVVVSHRLDSISKCDHIILVDDGKVQDSGTHSELLSRSAAYDQLWNLQQENLNWAFGRGRERKTRPENPVNLASEVLK